MKRIFQSPMNVLSLLLLFTLGLGSCVDKEFDEPPFTSTNVDPELDIPTVTVSDILARWSPGDYVEITDDVAMEAVVVADDESGNFYKTLVVSDSLGQAGISIIIDDFDLFNTYPVGRKIFVKVNGLYVGDNRGLPQLGTAPVQDGNFTNLGRIPAALKEEIILPGKRNVNFTIKDKTLSQLGINDYNTLVRIQGLEFTANSLGDTYANFQDPQSGVNHNLTDCDDNRIIIRNSDYATFARDMIPEGNGSIVAVFSVFGNDSQLFIRDTEDIDFTGERCSGGNTGGGDQVSIQSLRQAYASGTTTPPDGYVQGVVISDRSTGNFQDQNMVLQDGDFGITVRFWDAHSYNLGDEVRVDLAGAELGEFRGLVQLSSVELDNASDQGSSSLPAPKEVTVSELLADNDLQSTRVLIKDATIGGAANFGFNDVTDNTGTIDFFTFSGASFASQNVPTGSVNITAIASRYDDPQILINDADDVSGGGGNTGGSDCDQASGEISLEDLRCKWEDGDATIADNTISGIIISDRDGGNINNQNIQIQNGEYGIVVRFDEQHGFTMGLEVSIDVANLELSEFNGILQINGVMLDAVTVMGQGTMPTPRSATIQEVLDNSEAWESTLVRIEDVQVSGGSTWGDANTLTDDSGSIATYTSGFASFSGSSVPSGSVTLTGIVGQFNDPQVLIRNLDDVN